MHTWDDASPESSSRRAGERGKQGQELCTGDSIPCPRKGIGSPGDLWGKGAAPESPKIRTFKVGINHFGRMLIRGALKLSKKEWPLQDGANGIPILGIRMTQESRMDP